MTDDVSPRDDVVDIAAWPRGRELAAIVAFWLVYGALSVTNGLYPPGGQGLPLSTRSLVTWGLESLLWMLATPVVFWITSRFGVEGERRASRIAIYVLTGLVLALVVALVVEWARRRLPMGPPTGGPPPPDRVPRPLWALTRGRYLSESMIAAAVVAAGLARAYVIGYRRRVEEAARLRTQLADARLAMLRSQLNPHFLYNTLNAIAALVDEDPRGVRRMIARLSELLRVTIEPSTEVEVPLARELSMLERYLEILRIRFQGRLETSIDAPALLHDALVPPMILQPLVENAMKHAVSKTATPSKIVVIAERQRDELVLTVRDSGAQAADASVSDTTAGVGLRNTRARLREIYEDHCSLALVRTETGTDATIRLPYHTTGDLRAMPAAAGSG